MTNTLIKAIFFDFYNTIGKFDPSREQLQMVACRSFGINVTQQGIIKGYANADSYMAKQVSVRPLRDMNPEEFDDFFAEPLDKPGLDSGCVAEVARALEADPRQSETE